MTRQDIRQGVRDGLHEMVADLWTDDQINRHISDELRSLPGKNVYREVVNDSTFTANSYTLEISTIDSTIEIIEDIWQNNGTTASPDWGNFMYEWSVYGGSIYVKTPPSADLPVRVFSQNSFAELTKDTTTIDVPNNTVELVVVGSILRCYRSLMSYIMNTNNLDLAARPNAVTATQLQNWVTEVKKDYKELLGNIRYVQSPREINLVF